MAVLTAVSATVLADKAYIGLRNELGEQRCRIPRQKTRYKPKSDAERALEHQWSRERMPVEHSIGRMKWWRVLRWWRAADHRFASTGKAIAVLASIT
jgi:hypothetical protein